MIFHRSVDAMDPSFCFASRLAQMVEFLLQVADVESRQRKLQLHWSLQSIHLCTQFMLPTCVYI